jgi:uncharacterized delta-60 repeat protein
MATVVAVMSIDFPLIVDASAGGLDPGFGAGGKVVTEVGADARGRSLAVQPDGKLILAGSAGDDFVLVRYNPDGSPDSTFGSGGKVTTDFGADDSAQAVVILNDGRIVAAGARWLPMNDLSIALSCYNPDASLDAAFGAGGTVTTRVSGFCAALALDIQPDGKLVAAGRSEGSFALVRYNPDGSLDPTFGSGGAVITDLRQNVDEVYDIAILADGRIVAAGISQTKPGSNTSDFAIVRYNPDGSLDTTFGKDGKVIKDFFGDDDTLTSVTVQRDGRLVVAGYATQGRVDPFFTFARYDVDGSLDSSFGDGGVVISGPRGYFGACAVGIQPDGRIVAAGPATRPGNYDDFCLIRLNLDGSRDLSFGSDGTVFTDFLGHDDGANSLVILPDGRIAVGGYTRPNFQTSHFALACYQNDLDTAPQIAGADVVGKKLFVHGANFDVDAKIYLNGDPQKTRDDENSPTEILIGKKAGKKVEPGESVMIEVRNGSRRVSNAFKYTRPVE